MKPGFPELLQGTDTFFPCLSSLLLCLVTLAQKVFCLAGSMKVVGFGFCYCFLMDLSHFRYKYIGGSSLSLQLWDTIFKELILLNLSKREKMVLGMYSNCSFIPSAKDLHSVRHMEIRPGSDPFAEVKFSLQSSDRRKNMVFWIFYLNLLLSHMIFLYAVVTILW